MISYLSGWILRPCARAILSAPSMDSAPELQKNVRCESAGFRQPFRQRPLIVVVIEIGGVQQAAGLFADHLHDARVRVSQRVYADAGDQIEIAPPAVRRRSSLCRAPVPADNGRSSGADIRSRALARDRGAGPFRDRQNSGHRIMIAWTKMPVAALAP